MSEKLTPVEWMERTGIRIMDPDGWRHKKDGVMWTDSITREDFIRRAMESTCMRWPKPLLDERV